MHDARAHVLGLLLSPHIRVHTVRTERRGAGKDLLLLLHRRLLRAGYGVHWLPLGDDAPLSLP